MENLAFRTNEHRKKGGLVITFRICARTGTGCDLQFVMQSIQENTQKFLCVMLTVPHKHRVQRLDFTKYWNRNRMSASETGKTAPIMKEQFAEGNQQALSWLLSLRCNEKMTDFYAPSDIKCQTTVSFAHVTFWFVDDNSKSLTIIQKFYPAWRLSFSFRLVRHMLQLLWITEIHRPNSMANFSWAVG